MSMLIVDVIFWEEIEPIKTKIICSLAWFYYMQTFA